MVRLVMVDQWVCRRMVVPNNHPGMPFLPGKRPVLGVNYPSNLSGLYRSPAVCCSTPWWYITTTLLVVCQYLSIINKSPVTVKTFHLFNNWSESLTVLKCLQSFILIERWPTNNCIWANSLDWSGNIRRAAPTSPETAPADQTKHGPDASKSWLMVVYPGELCLIMSQNQQT